MKTVGKRAIFFFGAGILLALSLLIGSETAGRFRAGAVKEVTGLRVRIKTLQIPLPESPGDFPFCGTTQTPAIYVPDGASVSGDLSAARGGTYTIVYSLDDPAHSVWADGTTGDKEVTWRITPKSVGKPNLINGKRPYTGGVEEPIYGPVTPYIRMNGTLSAVAPGNYRMKVMLLNERDYIWEDGTTAPIFFDWQIGVCRIGDTLYPSVSAAFETDLSTETEPVEMITNWKEEAVNETGSDWLSLNGYTLTSEGVTIGNHAELTILGYGTVESRITTVPDAAVVLNQGTLSIRGGTFRMENEGENEVTDRVSILKTTGGTMQISGGTFEGNGGSTQIAGIRADGGTVEVSGGEFTAENTSPTGFTAGIIVTDADVTVTGGSFTSHAKNTTSMGYHTESGRLTITGGETHVFGEPGFYTVFANALGDAYVTVGGGTHSVEGQGGLNGFMVGAGSHVMFTDGSLFLHPVCPDEGQTANGIYLSGGTMEMSGGTLTLHSELPGGGTLVGTAAGALTISGGAMHLTSIASVQYGMNVPFGTVSVENLTMTVSVFNGTAGAFTATYDEGTLRVISGDFTVTGDYATPGRGYSAAHPIENDPASESCAFSLHYRSGWSQGEFFRYTPYLRETAEIRALQAGRTRAIPGTIMVSGRLMVVQNTELTEIPQAKSGVWTAEYPEEDGVILRFGTNETDENTESEVLSIAPLRQIGFLTEAYDLPELHLKRPLMIRRLLWDGKETRFPGTGMPMPHAVSQTVGIALPIDPDQPVEVRLYRNEAQEAVFVEIREPVLSEPDEEERTGTEPEETTEPPSEEDRES